MAEIKTTANAILSLLSDRAEISKGEVYRIDEKLVLDDNASLFGNGATVIAENGIEVVGSQVSLCDCKIISGKGIIVSGDDCTIQNCKIEASIKISGKYFIARNNKINAGGGIKLDGAENALVAQNIIGGAVEVNDSFNCVVILNNATNIAAENNTNLYVIKNDLASALSVESNKYLICDENRASSVISLGNEETNGDNITNITSRPEFGVNEELLPHTNKECFVGMERRASVTDPYSDKKMSFGGYLRAKAAEGNVVIVPPGVYTVDEDIVIGAAQSNTDIYCYGVLAEATYLGEMTKFDGAKNINFKGLTWGYGLPHSGQLHIVKLLGDRRAIGVVSAGYGEEYGNSDKTVFRTTHESRRHRYEDLDYAGLGGNYDIEKNPDSSFLLTFHIIQPYNVSPYRNLEKGDILMCRMAGDNKQTVTVWRSEGIHFKDVTMHGYAQGTHFRNQYCKDVSYERYHATPRPPFVIDEATYNKYKAWEKEYDIDLEVYIDEKGRYRGAKPRIGGTGTMEVANADGGVNLTSCTLDRGYDDGCNQRGTSSRLAGFKDNGDGTYTAYYKGCVSQIYHSLNTQKQVWNAMNTAAVQKGDIVAAYGSNGAVLFGSAVALEDARIVTNSTEHWVHIDLDGDAICDECGMQIYDDSLLHPAKNAHYAPEKGEITFEIEKASKAVKGDAYYSAFLYEVKLKAENVNLSALDGYDLLSNDYYSQTQFFFDNVSKNCYKFTFDNVLIMRNRARGILIKTQDVTVKNCTFKDVQIEGLIIGKEINWGESTVPRNVNVHNCVFDNTSYSHREDMDNIHYTPINIQGLGEIRKNIELNENFACSDITITHNKFVNNTARHIIYASGVKGLKINENVFEERADGGKVLYINGCIDVEVKDNIYTENMQKHIDKGELDGVFALYNHRSLTIEGKNITDSDKIPE